MVTSRMTRLDHVLLLWEKWRAETIPHQIGVHRDVVARVLARFGLPAHAAVLSYQGPGTPAVYAIDM